MKKSIYVLAINFFLSVIGLIKICIRKDSNEQTIIYSSLVVLIFVVIELIKEMNIIDYNKKKILSVIEIIIAIVFIKAFKLNIVLYYIPIAIFDILGYNSSLSIIIAIVLSVFLAEKDEVFNIIIFDFLFMIYLCNVDKKNKVECKLSETNKKLRELEYVMKKKMINLDSYLEQNSVITSLKERNYISQKLHDKLGHRIAGSIMQLEVAKEVMTSDIDSGKKYLINSINNLREGMEEIRSFLHNVKPEENLISIEHINEIITKFQYFSGINCSFKISGDTESISSNVMEVFKDNIVEALTNVAKYSKATKIDISLFVYNKIVRLEIRDNGVGFDLNKESNYGIGLKGMKERVKSIGGKINFYNDNGFVINIIVGV